MLSNLLGAASNALTRVVSSNNRTSTQSAERSDEFANKLNSAIGEKQAAAEAAALEEEMAAKEMAAPEDIAAGEALAAALEIAEQIGAEMRAPRLTVIAGGAATAAAPDPTQVNRSLAGLDSEFRAKLEKVIERMSAEFGHDVTVVETVRSQTRQNFLFEQGRTRPGDVVTWTLNSNHTEGRATDVMIDGSYDNALAFRRLAQIAREEGLRTLGARDPGHIELPGSGSGNGNGGNVGQFASSAQSAASPVNAAGVARVANVAQVAPVAQPARVAGVAQVARVATVATPGAVSRRAGAAEGAESARPAVERGLPVEIPSINARIAHSETAPAAKSDAVPTELHAAIRGGREAGESSSDRDESNSRSEQQAAETRLADTQPARETAPPVSSVETARSASTTAVREMAAPLGSDAVERVARVLQIQEGSANRELSQVVLRIDNADGGQDHIRIDLRGGTVGASISTNDPAAAERMGSRIGDLQRALENQGLEAEYLQVRSTSSTHGAELGEKLASATLTDVSGGSRSSNSGSQNDGERSHNPDRYRNSDNADQRQQRPRREPKQEKNA